MAGGDSAIRRAAEGAEDNKAQGWMDIEPYRPTPDDTVIGIAASGTTPYVIGAVEEARRRGLLTGCITCNPDAPVAAAAEIPIVAVVGPEFVTGSTRMKSGTAQKLVLNMISTSVMIRLGHVKGNKMVDMQLTNKKLVDRGTKMIMDETGIEDYGEAKAMLLRYGSVRNAVDTYFADNPEKHR
jgi:Predicted sugar phosphate isomerase